MKDLRERAMELNERILAWHKDPKNQGNHDFPSYQTFLLEQHESALLATRREALEEAAKILDGRLEYACCDCRKDHDKFAAKIRALVKK